MSESVHRLSLAQQIAQLEDAAPTDFDPEDVEVRGVDPEGESTTDPSAGREHYVDVGPSTIRKLHDSVADPKYSGVRTTRKQLIEDSNADDQTSEDAKGTHDTDVDVTPLSFKTQPAQPTQTGEELVDDISSNLRKTREEDRKKGKAVSRQLAIWDTLLDARIRLQKFVTTTNKLPSPSAISDLSPSVHDSLIKMLGEATLLSDELLELQESLLITNESIQPPPHKKRKINLQENPSLLQYSSELEDATLSASALQNTYHPHLLLTLSKWSSKIQAVAPSVLLPSSRSTFSRSSQHQQTAVQLIDEILADQSKLLARTQTLRTKDMADGDINTVQVFDDMDFYQQLLRDVIDSRGNGIGGGGDEWLAIQKQKKASKKKVDTKASKGRKLRYEVHEKLQNFMVPVPTHGSWHEEQIDELFASILGNGFANTEVQDIAAEVPDGKAQKRPDQTMKEGFRVFG